MMIEQQAYLRSAAPLVLAAALGVAGYFAVDPVVAAAWRDGRHDLLGAVSATPVTPGSNQNSRMAYSFTGRAAKDPASLEYRQERIRLTYSRAAFFAFSLAVLAHMARRRQLWRARVQSFVDAADNPLTLGVFRALVFGLLFFARPGSSGAFSRFDTSRWIWFADFPRELAMPPPGLGFVLQWNLIDARVAHVLALVFITLSFTAAIGLFSRLSAAGAVLCGLYVWGLPKFFGATFYQQSLFWFGAICASAPCGRAFSVDALLRAWWTPALALELQRAPSAAAGRAARVVWLAYGIIYFFPGFWKIWDTGFDWIFSDNLISVMRARWIDYNRIPALRIDQLPWFGMLGAFAVVYFELAFVFNLFFRRLRWAMLVAGAGFHGMIATFLHINFLYNAYCYVIFVDVRAVFVRIGRALFGAPLSMRFDPACANASRLVALVATVDVLGAFDIAPQPGLAARLTVGDVAVGGVSLPALVLRLPAAWPLFPVVAPLAWLAWRSADPPSPRANEASAGAATIVAARDLRSRRTVTFVGAFVLGGGLVAGGLQHDQGWPFACFPPFGWVAGPYRHTIQLTAYDATGAKMPYNEQVIIKRLSGNWNAQIVGNILLTRDPELRAQRLRAFWQLAMKAEPKLQAAVRVQIDEAYLRLDPDRTEQEVLSRAPLGVIVREGDMFRFVAAQ